MFDDAFRKEKLSYSSGDRCSSKGLDVDHIKYVFNYDLPSCPEDYLHRIGRIEEPVLRVWLIIILCIWCILCAKPLLILDK